VSNPLEVCRCRCVVNARAGKAFLQQFMIAFEGVGRCTIHWAVSLFALLLVTTAVTRKCNYYDYLCAHPKQITVDYGNEFNLLTSRNRRSTTARYRI
jgi:hypothetical protein